MKRIKGKSIIIVLCMILLFFLQGCGHIDLIMKGIPQYDSATTYYGNGFQDYTDYCKYFYNSESVKKFEGNSKFKKMTEKDIKNIESYFDNFEGWVIYQAYSDRYDFKLSQIKVNDYYYVIDKDGTPIGDGFYEKYEDYDVYYVDMEKCIMYYIHNNI